MAGAPNNGNMYGPTRKRSKCRRSFMQICVDRPLKNARVSVNGHEAGTHRGGFHPFTHAVVSGENELEI